MFTEALERQTQNVMDMVHERPKPISSRTHAILDYLTVAKMLAIPRILGARPAVTSAVTALALTKLAYAMLTDHEGGIIRKIPLRTHLMLDAAGGAGLIAVPFLLDEDNDIVTWSLVALGLFDIAAAPMTQTNEEYATQLECWAGFRPIIDNEV
jgi:hypothetical protein